MKLSTLTSMEEQIMQLIWSLEKPYLRDIMQALPEPKSHQNTVSTYLKILIEKDYLRTEKEGRIFRYIPRVDKETYLKNKLQVLSQDFFEGSLKELHAFMQRSLFNEEQIEDSTIEQATTAATKSEQDHTNVAKKVATKTEPKKPTHKKYEQQIAAFVSGLEKVNKKKKSKSKKEKSTSSKKKSKKDKKVKKEKDSKQK